MEEWIVEPSSVKDPIDRTEAKGPEAKKPYHKPGLTKYQQLTEITLSIQCSSLFCSPVQDPFQ
jgi:hypothetical protein